MAEQANLQTRRLLFRVSGIGLAFWLALLFLWLGPRQHSWFVLIVLAAFIAAISFTVFASRELK